VGYIFGVPPALTLPNGREPSVSQIGQYATSVAKVRL
jgi:hypothetical protein